MSREASHLPDLTNTRIDSGHLHLTSFLGAGGFGKVYRAVDTRTPSDDPSLYAVKCLRNDALGTPHVTAIRRELRLHAFLQDLPGVVSFERAFIEDDFVFVVLELCAMDVHRFAVVERGRRRGPDVIRTLFVEMVDAVGRMHDRGVFHRDLKPGNILCDERGREVRIADFGLATSDEWPTDGQWGTTSFMSPEAMEAGRSGVYSARECDYWALAITFVVLVTGSYPWEAAHVSDKRYAAFRTDPVAFLNKYVRLSVPATNFIRWMLDPAARNRPTLKQIRDTVLQIDCFLLPAREKRVRRVLPPAVSSIPVVCALPSLDSEAPSALQSGASGAHPAPQRQGVKRRVKGAVRMPMPRQGAGDVQSIPSKMSKQMPVAAISCRRGSIENPSRAAAAVVAAPPQRKSMPNQATTRMPIPAVPGHRGSFARSSRQRAAGAVVRVVRLPVAGIPGQRGFDRRRTRRGPGREVLDQMRRVPVAGTPHECGFAPRRMVRNQSARVGQVLGPMERGLSQRRRR
ncbi:unnamed protein product [Mycena citricolor]|uniref:Protein kinase domain-containing protein n=1 Tax=Mycena citricolor TaxID=2018698 RepID=A0AAD2I077_9AGAR|nr:unnamed protein product [Mycena citricolor]